MYPSQSADKLMLRFPDGMRPRLKAIAAMNRRSMNAEIILMLERALSSANAATGDSFAGDAPAAASDDTARQGGPIHHRS